MKLQIASDKVSGAYTNIWLDDKKTDDVEALQLNMTAQGLNTVTMIRHIDGTRVEMQLVGGEAFRRLRLSAVDMLARLREVKLPPEQITAAWGPVAAATDQLAAAVEAVQAEVAGKPPSSPYTPPSSRPGEPVSGAALDKTFCPVGHPNPVRNPWALASVCAVCDAAMPTVMDVLLSAQAR
jgi:hypothetical protein